MAREAFRSLYGDLTKLKDDSLLKDPAGGAADDTELFQLLLAVSDWVDHYCNRHFYPDGHSILMITEPGMIGKIGMNSAGLGVCLNILTLARLLDGLPVHIILRAILNCKSLAQVNSLLARHSAGKASNIMVADAGGNGFDMEFCAENSYRIEPASDYLLHTNHYLDEVINSAQDPDFFSSYARFNKATQILSDNKERSVSAMCDLLSDESDGCLAIYREYMPDDSVQELGTICTIVMELAQQKMHIRKGKGPNATFIEYRMEAPVIV